jgi:hypothetical protein
MGPNPVTTTQAGRLKNRVGIMKVEMKNRKKARKKHSKSAPGSIEIHARSSDEAHSAPPTAATASSHFSRLKIR